MMNFFSFNCNEVINSISKSGAISVRMGYGLLCSKIKMVESTVGKTVNLPQYTFKLGFKTFA